ncbi:hypothetical protein ZIOFF_008883 [Zingiber officinale]|uniref:beta-galactosidase n=1 Tax=Zingiber officinale TaxID=94328 RepID=A0A8J5I3Y5_ZINOF|nr:hypothetical protein ZIOFF_008883 [Zingiber officinale]
MHALSVEAQNVTCDARFLIADGEGHGKLIVSGSIHHPHTLSVFSLQHYLEERLDLVEFAKIVGDAGLRMILRIRPYVATEWTYGLSVTLYRESEDTGARSQRMVIDISRSSFLFSCLLQSLAMATSPRLFLFLFLFLFATVVTAAQNVTYDARSLIIDGERRLIISGSIHYPRSMWPGLVAEAKEGGLNAIDTYVFWNGHEPSPGNDRFDLVKFAKIVRDAGLYMILRIGPFVAAEWTYGGIPVWLHYVPGTVFRTNNEPFKIENEYGYSESYFGDEGKLYAMWAAHMALNQGTGVPWVMGQQDDAPDPVINTCNSFYCDQFTPNSPSKPKLWTENWPGWFHSFGDPDPHRPPEDIAFAVARFFEKGGCLQNYYVYHGGTHYGRTTGGPFITTSYDYNAPIDEYGLPRLPKWGHLRELHKSVKLCEHTLLYGKSTFISAGPLQEIDVYEDQSGGCVAFLANVDEQEDKSITFRNVTYSVPPWSVSILPDCKNVVFNTAMVKSQTSVVEMVPENLKVYSNSSFGSGAWQVYMEKVGLWDKPDFVLFGLEDHINITKDTTDYLCFYVDKSEDNLGDGSSPILSVASLGHAFIVFINGELQGAVLSHRSSYGKYGYLPLNFEAPVTIKPGKNEIAILSMTIGMYKKAFDIILNIVLYLKNAGPLYEWEGAGLTSVNISGTGNGSLNLSPYSWEYKIGLEGEHYSIFNTNSNTDIKWIPKSEPPTNQSLIWYKVAVDPPEGKEPVALDMVSMGKGHVWDVDSPLKDGIIKSNGFSFSIPRAFIARACRYHIPRSFFKPSGNTLVIFEEKGGDPTRITFARRQETKICGFVSDDHPQVDLENWEVHSKRNAAGAAMHLKCPEGSSVSSITFASFGNPTGTCSSYRRGSCHYPNSVSVTEKACLHKDKCSIAFKGESFTEDLCPGTAKAMALAMARGSRLFFLLFFFLFAPVAIAVHSVSYDARSLVIDGERKLIISGSIHYPRSVPSMWPGLVAAAKEGGLNTIETYVFWNGHEPSPGNERFDLVKFAKIVRDAGLYMILRIGPFVGAEWTYGGIPVWLHYVPGTVFRTNNEPFKRHMENFITYIVNLMKREQLFASQGGHIILAQASSRYHPFASPIMLKMNMAFTKATMEMQGNNMRCGLPIWHSIKEPVYLGLCVSKMMPLILLFHTFGEPDPHRPPEDIAFAVARFFQKGGGPFITTSYDYNAPIDEYGLPRLPKWGHLRELHGSIKLCEHTLLYGESEFFSVGPLQEVEIEMYAVNVYKDKFGGCVAFLANIDEQEYKFITFRNVRYSVPPWSVSILPDCKNVVFNTAKVRSQASVVEMVPENLQASSTSSLGLGAWQIYTEKVGLWDKPDFAQFGLKDHLNVTKDTTDYLCFYVGESEEIIGNGSSPILSVESKGHAFLVFINGELQGSSYGNSGNLHLRFQAPVILKTGQNEIAILSMTIGMYNAGPLYEWQGAGLTSVKISGNRIGSLDLSTNLWKYKIGLQGERYNIFNTDITDIKWIPVSEPPKNQALIWYKVAVDPPEGNEPVALDMLSMGKGHVWVNGKSIGRYWLVTSSIYAKCTPHCNYTGKFKPDKCLTRCGEPTQRWYHIPRSFFKSSGNTLIIFEERGGDPTKITFAKRHETMICSFISEDHPQLDLENWDANGKDNAVGSALMNLKCPEGTSISSIIFASFGNPSGTCSSYSQGSCHYSNSISVIEKACLHRNDCSISFVNESFTEEDLCPGITKALAVEAAWSRLLQIRGSELYILYQTAMALTYAPRAWFCVGPAVGSTFWINHEAVFWSLITLASMSYWAIA